MNSARMQNDGDSYPGPMRWLLGTVVAGILMVVIAATLLRKPVTADPFDAPAPAPEATAPGQ